MNKRLAVGTGIGLVILVTAVLIGLGGGILPAAVDETKTPTANPSAETMKPETDAGSPYQTARVGVDLVDWDQWPAIDEPIGVNVSAEARGYTNLSYDDLRLCAYDENGSVLFAKPLGSLRSPDSGTFYRVYTVNMTTTTPPAYVTVDHPGLRNDTRVMVDVLTWDAETEQLNRRTSNNYTSLVEVINRNQDEFSFPRTHKVGRCG
ncbi:hypothetical protein [Halosimplex sp. TS25]|uniref:hypothetical protein n=1 Tax=Halosimplex rarum TaxID=3396619 RepID=UPI0039EA158F